MGRALAKLEQEAAESIQAKAAKATGSNCSLIEHQRIKTTLAKAKAVRPLAERMVTLGKQGSVHARRMAFSTLRQKDAVKKLFDEIAPRSTPSWKSGPRASASSRSMATARCTAATWRVAG